MIIICDYPLKCLAIKPIVDLKFYCVFMDLGGILTLSKCYNCHTFGSRSGPFVPELISVQTTFVFAKIIKSSRNF